MRTLGEFDLIKRYFAEHGPQRGDVLLGIGDDAALTRVPPGMALVTAVDTLVAGVHFPLHTDPAAIGHKALAVNLSDLAAMGATPAWATLALTLPSADSAWLDAFCAGFFALAAAHHVQLIGGDTTRGPLTITVGIHGTVAAHHALRRDGARVGDWLYVTGSLGDAGLGLLIAQRTLAADARSAGYLLDRLDCPTPRVAAGLALRGLASACIDISDGLLADLGHILKRSNVGATIELAQLPLSESFMQLATPQQRDTLPLHAGDDYELCFSVPPERAAWAAEAVTTLGLRCTHIGYIEATPGLRVRDADGACITHAATGYQHFGA